MRTTGMKILVVGGGGREHAIVDAIGRSKRVSRIFCAPGNAGIASIAECVPIGTMDFAALADFAEKESVDLTVVSMDDPLCAGITDYFEDRGLRIFGTRKNAAIIEGSKAFAKELMLKYDIPTAKSVTFTDPAAALSYLEKTGYPAVLKADGLALGKGVLICADREEAAAGIREIMIDKKFGDAGNCVVIEEFLTGREVSVLAFADGKHIVTMSSAQDHKRIGDNDTGPNTGGMGTFSPSPFYTADIDRICREKIYQRTIDAMAAEGRPFKGVLFFGLMLTEEGPKVLEYNTRFGDPETQVVLPRLENDIIDVMEACMDGTLDRIELKFSERAAVCVVLASGGYPGSYEKGKIITGLDELKNEEDVYCYHAGTAFDSEGNIVTNGGRVLGVCALGGDLISARAKAYEAAGRIHFEGKYFRTDIGNALFN